MIKGKVYEVLYKYLGEYLFGFDKSKLEVAILSGLFRPDCRLHKPEGRECAAGQTQHPVRSPEISLRRESRNDRPTRNQSMVGIEE